MSHTKCVTAANNVITDMMFSCVAYYIVNIKICISYNTAAPVDSIKLASWRNWVGSNKLKVQPYKNKCCAVLLCYHSTVG